ncbi:MAG: glycosyltransferase [Candidatus Nanopelagicales bacterium]
MIEPPLVDVLVPAYNHEEFVAQALDSILMQSIDAPFQITVLEDFSTDATRSIVQRYASTHPEIIRLRLNEHNLNNGRSMMAAIEQSRATYIAVLEGDDYWVSADKLQKQVDLLDQHADCAFAHHNFHVVYDDGRASHLKHPPGQQGFSSIHDMFRSNFVSTCSTMYRRSSLQAIPEWFCDALVGDWPLHLLAARSGRIAYIDEPMATYRIHAGGLWSKMSPVAQAETTVTILKQMFGQFEPEYYADIRNGLANGYRDLANAQAAAGDHEGANRSHEAHVDALSDVLSELWKQRASTEDKLRTNVALLRASQAALAATEAELQGLVSSRSWRATRSLRVAAAALRKISRPRQ